MKRIFIALTLALSTAASFGATLVPIQLLNSTGSTAGQVPVSTGPATAPGWASVPLSGLSSIAANTVLANATASSAAPAAFAMPSCSTSVSALTWTTSSGFTCNTGLITSATVSSTYAPLASPTFTGTVTIPGGTVNNATIGLTTPLAGKFTTLTATGAITPSSTAGIVGTTTNDSPTAGSIGELIENSTATTSATSGTALNASSISLTAGEWDVSGICATNPAATTTTSIVICGISTTSATFQNIPGAGGFFYAQAETASFPANSQEFIAAPVRQIKLASTTTIYIVGQANFSTSTLTISGYIRARRVR